MIVILTACGSAEDADRIAAALVEERLAACVQIVPVRSVYRWQGRIERAGEWQLQIKTRAALADAVEARIKALHGYELPEIVALPVAAGSSDYIGWVHAETAEPSR
ncbi:divalent-cation tolerance protein CutA [Rhizorhabdus dicambivorans]|uniref:Divalent-cation tolerance protein CutA n=1 Tax=Rhizorhabdus dicambivorans TaxID=1850238 RepID=A0A2A4FT69_9SPHN|nr:divalent-cation tolerance protein CutA [Rhizorhabdus dicambivorans]ATE64337.1 divalent-cation tolerance protein CutA [Rhizorhabdus dicambivorans]PCE40896.1 divalent-cation tolerance protein CutA [Rhizorhabdus dicambivorans]